MAVVKAAEQTGLLETIAVPIISPVVQPSEPPGTSVAEVVTMYTRLFLPFRRRLAAIRAVDEDMFAEYEPRVADGYAARQAELPPREQQTQDFEVFLFRRKEALRA